MKLFVAVVIFVLGSIVFADEDSPYPAPSPGKESQPVQNSGCDEEQEATAYNGPTEKLLAFLNQTATVNAAQDKPDPSSNPGQKSSDDWIVWLTGALVFVGIAQVFVGAVQACIYYRQARVMRRQLKAARLATKAAQQSADAAKKSADTALLQVKIMENRERPWVMLNADDIKVEQGIFSDPFKFEFKWGVENIGSSPAFVTELIGEVKSVSLPIPDEVPKYPEKEPFAQVILPPSGRYEHRESGSMVPSDGQAFWGGRKAVAFYGFIKYHGAFSGPHCTRFYGYWVWNEGTQTYFPVGPPKTVEYT